MKSLRICKNHFHCMNWKLPYAASGYCSEADIIGQIRFHCSPVLESGNDLGGRGGVHPTLVRTGYADSVRSHAREKGDHHSFEHFGCWGRLSRMLSGLRRSAVALSRRIPLRLDAEPVLATDRNRKATESLNLQAAGNTDG